MLGQVAQRRVPIYTTRTLSPFFSIYFFSTQTEIALVLTTHHRKNSMNPPRGVAVRGDQQRRELRGVLHARKAGTDAAEVLQPACRHAAMLQSARGDHLPFLTSHSAATTMAMGGPGSLVEQQHQLWNIGCSKFNRRW